MKTEIETFNKFLIVSQMNKKYFALMYVVSITIRII